MKIKPTNKHVIGEFPLLAKTVYSTEYVPRKTSKSDYEKQHDSLRTGANWFGASTYNKSFRLPNPEHYPEKAVNVEKYYKKPDYPHQFGIISLMKRPIIRMNLSKNRRRFAPQRSS